MRRTEQVDLAIKFAEIGLKIIPEDRNRVPKFKDWPSKGSSDPEQIRKWAKQWPTCIFSAITGEASGFFALDIDIKNGAKGQESWEKLKADLGIKGIKTMVTRTGSGGHHVYLKLPNGKQIPCLDELPGYPGIEVKGTYSTGSGGKVILPGSSYSDGREYVLQQTNDWVIGEAPEGLIPLLDPGTYQTKASNKAKREKILSGEKIPKTERHNTLRYLAAYLKGKKLGRDDILRGLAEFNRNRCDPPVEMKEVVDLADWAAGKGTGFKDIFDMLGGKENQADKLVRLADEVELFHWKLEGYGIAPVKEHHETLLVKGRSFKRWLQHRYYGEYDSAPGTDALARALGIIEGKALFASPEEEVFVRIAGDDKAIFLDLGDPEWRVLRVDDRGWILEDSPETKFRRPAGMGEIPFPKRGGKIEKLREFLNVDNEEDWILILSWLIAAFRPRGPYPVLSLHGEQGSAKSTAARILKTLVDPSFAPLRTSPKLDRDLMIAGNNGWCLSFDNLSSLPDWLSDAICRLSTGGGLSTRTLFTDEEETIFEAQRPVILNGIEDVATRGDLLDRTIIVYLPQIDDKERLTEKEFDAWFTKEHPGILGALLDVVSSAIGRLPEVSVKELPRMADFAEWVVAAESALPWEEGRFLEAYNLNRARIHELALEAAPISEAIRTIAADAEEGEWRGTSGELLEEMETRFGKEKMTEKKGWPTSARGVSGALRRLTPVLRKVGIEVIWKARTTGGRRELILRCIR